MSSHKITSIAPGRVCLFGDHQDYLGLPIIACAIDRKVEISGTPNGSSFFNLEMPDLGVERKIAINAENDSERTEHLKSALRVLKRNGCIPTEGYDLLVKGDIPINAGLSSSSALVVAWIQLLVDEFGIEGDMNAKRLAELAYAAEVVEVAGSGGKMDMYSIAFGDIIYLETDNDSSVEKLNLPNCSLIIGESGIPKATDDVLRDRKNKAIHAIKILKEKISGFKISKVEFEMEAEYLKYLPHELHQYFTAALQNYQITKQAKEELFKAKPDSYEIGRLIDQHHFILKNKLDLTLPKIDAMIESAKNAGGLGAKIVGSGKGGSILALSSVGQEQEIIKVILNAGAKAAYQVSISSGPEINKI